MTSVFEENDIQHFLPYAHAFAFPVGWSKEEGNFRKFDICVSQVFYLASKRIMTKMQKSPVWAIVYEVFDDGSECFFAEGSMCTEVRSHIATMLNFVLCALASLPISSLPYKSRLQCHSCTMGLFPAFTKESNISVMERHIEQKRTKKRERNLLMCQLVQAIHIEDIRYAIYECVLHKKDTADAYDYFVHLALCNFHPSIQQCSFRTSPTYISDVIRTHSWSPGEKKTTQSPEIAQLTERILQSFGSTATCRYDDPCTVMLQNPIAMKKWLEYGITLQSEFVRVVMYVPDSPFDWDCIESASVGLSDDVNSPLPPRQHFPSYMDGLYLFVSRELLQIRERVVLCLLWTDHRSLTSPSSDYETFAMFPLLNMDNESRTCIYLKNVCRLLPLGIVHF